LIDFSKIQCNFKDIEKFSRKMPILCENKDILSNLVDPNTKSKNYSKFDNYLD